MLLGFESWGWGVGRGDGEALGREEAEEELAGPGGAWSQAGVGEQNPKRGSGGVSQAQGGRPPGWLGIEQDESRATGSILASPPPNSHIIYWTYPVYPTLSRVLRSEVETRGHHLLFEPLPCARSRQDGALTEPADKLQPLCEAAVISPTWLKRKLRLRGVK